MAPSCPGKAALPFSTRWPPALSRTGRQRARMGPMRGEASPPAAGGGQRGKPRSSGPGPGPRPPALHGPGGHAFTSLPVLSPHRACVGPELLSKRCISMKSRRLGVASQRSFLAVPRPPGVAGGREVAGPRSPSRWLQAPRGGNASGRECGARWRSKGGAPALGLARSPETTVHCHLCLGLAGDGLSAVRIALSLVDTQRPAALTDREVACRPSPRHATPSCLSPL